MTNKVNVNELIEKEITAEIAERGASPAQLRQEAKEAASAKIKTLAKAFNAAAGLFEGLEALKNRPHSKFAYDVTENAQAFHVSTNIPVSTLYPANGKYVSWSNLFITVAKSGEITAHGDSNRVLDGYDKRYVTEQAHAGKGEDASKVLKFVARKAAARRIAI